MTTKSSISVVHSFSPATTVEHQCELTETDATAMLFAHELAASVHSNRGIEAINVEHFVIVAVISLGFSESQKRSSPVFMQMGNISLLRIPE